MHEFIKTMLTQRKEGNSVRWEYRDEAGDGLMLMICTLGDVDFSNRVPVEAFKQENKACFPKS